MVTMPRIGRAARLTLITLALVVVLWGTVWAEKSSSLVGKKIRVFVPSIDSRPISGRLIRVESDSVFLKVFQNDRSEVKGIPRTAIDRCDLRVGGRALVPEGLCLGMAVGTGLSVYDKSHNKRERFPFAYIGLGGAVGATLGALIRPSKWSALSPDQLFLSSPTSTTIRPGLFFTLRF